MNKHPYLRAYLAGIAIPTAFLLVATTGYIIIRYVYNLPVPIERVIVFPMAAVPNAWGLWNVLYRAFLASRHVSLGLFGGALPLLLAPCGYLIARLRRPPPRSLPCSLRATRRPDHLLSRLEAFRRLPQRRTRCRLNSTRIVVG